MEPPRRPPESAPRAGDRAIANWLFACALLVALMVVVGGVTRLTRSGLSIVEWQPLLGALPPVGEGAWLEEFAKYQRSPEFKLVNRHLDLAGFQRIYWVEWSHRLLGRLIGLAFGLPLLLFAVRGRLDGRRVRRFLALLLLGGLQGALGWFMVRSGLVDRPEVSPYRLTAHLTFALALFAALLWSALDERGADAAAAPPTPPPRRLVGGLIALLGITIVWGGLMAGFRAGHVAPTFPTMNGALLPDGLGALSPWPANLVANAVTIHFLHRLLAYLVAGLCLLLYARLAAWRPRVGALATALVALVVLQIALGALTVLHHVPIPLATLHQGNAVVLLAVALAILHRLRPLPSP